MLKKVICCNIFINDDPREKYEKIRLYSKLEVTWYNLLTDSNGDHYQRKISTIF